MFYWAGGRLWFGPRQRPANGRANGATRRAAGRRQLLPALSAGRIAAPVAQRTIRPWPKGAGGAEAHLGAWLAASKVGALTSGADKSAPAQWPPDGRATATLSHSGRI